MPDGLNGNDKKNPSYKPSMVIGFLCGVLTLVFFMFLVILSVMGKSVPAQDRYLVIMILGLGSSLSASFIGGSAAAKGQIPITLARNNPISFSVGGGIAVLIVVLVLGYVLYSPQNNRDSTPQIDTVIQLKKEYEGNQDFKLIFANIETCRPLYKSWGGPFTYQQINSYLNFLEHIGFLYKNKKIDRDTVDKTLGHVIVASYGYHEIRKYIDGIRTNAGQPLAGSDFYQLAEELSKDKEKYISIIKNCR